MTPQSPEPDTAFLAEGATVFPLSHGHFWRIGRSADNEIVLKSDVVSRCHAMVQRAEAGTFYLIDMGSRNGSFVNAARVSVPSALHAGDVISIGDRKLQFHSERPRPVPVQSRQLDATTKTIFACSKITVMVIDIRDFTGLTHRVEESILCQLIGTWFRKGGEILNSHGSWGQKYIGDAMMSVWVHKEETERQEMTNIFSALTQLFQMTAGLGRQFELSEAITIGAGLNTGYATIGNAGSEHLNDHTAMGDTVNAAFRFESASKETGLDVIIGNDTYLGFAEPAAFHALTVTLKGYDKPWSVWGKRM
jgi:adenylate cyclase